MCMSQVQGAAVETLDDHALLDLAERVLAALSARPLNAAVEDTDLAERVERLHRVETVAAAEKLRCVAAVDRAPSARHAWRASTCATRRSFSPATTVSSRCSRSTDSASPASSTCPSNG